MHLPLTAENPDLFPMRESALTYDNFLKRKEKKNLPNFNQQVVEQEMYCYNNIIHT